MDLRNILITAAGALAMALLLFLIVAAPGFLEDQKRAALHDNLLAGMSE